MDIMRGVHRDPGMSMLGVVPREERTTEGGRSGEVIEPSGDAGVGLQGLELRPREGVVIADLGAAERTGHAEVGEELRGALGGHGCTAVGVQGQRVRFNGMGM